MIFKMYHCKFTFCITTQFLTSYSELLRKQQSIGLLKKALLLSCILLIQSCVSEDPTVLSGEVVDTKTGLKIPGVTVLVSVYEKASFLTIPALYREDTLVSDSQGKFRLVAPYNEGYSRFTINVLKEVASGTFEFASGQDCSPYDCNSFLPGKVHQFKVRIPLDSL